MEAKVSSGNEWLWGYLLLTDVIDFTVPHLCLNLSISRLVSVHSFVLATSVLSSIFLLLAEHWQWQHGHLTPVFSLSAE